MTQNSYKYNCKKAIVTLHTGIRSQYASNSSQIWLSIGSPWQVDRVWTNFPNAKMSETVVHRRILFSYYAAIFSC